MHTMTVKTVEVRYQPSRSGEVLDKPGITGRFILSYLRDLDSDQEHLGILCLDAAHQLLGVKVLSSGTRTEAPIDFVRLWQTALKLGSHGIILFHNHPSGDLAPSRADLDLTRKIVIGAAFTGVECHDHIVTTAGPEGGRSLSLRHARPDIFITPSPVTV